MERGGEEKRLKREKIFYKVRGSESKIKGDKGKGQVDVEGRKERYRGVCRGGGEDACRCRMY